MSNAVRILVGVDGSPGSEAALRWALREARLWAQATHATDGDAGRPTVTALLAWTPDGLPSGVLQAATTADHEGLTRAAAEMLERTVKRAGEPAPNVDLRLEVVAGDPVPTLVRAGADADLLVIGEHGHGPLHRLVAGSVSQGVVHHATTPVVVARRGHQPDSTGEDDRPVVVGIDGSPGGLAALRWAARAATIRRVPLRVVHAWGGFDPLYTEVLVVAQGSLARRAQEVVDEAIKLGLDGSSDVVVDPVVSPEPPVRALLREAKDAQLLVVGSRGLGGFARLLLGSVSHQCVGHAACDTAVIRADAEAADEKTPA